MRHAMTLLVAIALTSCHHDHEEYANLMDCVADHTGEEGLTEVQAVATCLVDHIDVEFATLQECIDYVTANGGYPSSRMEACQIYIDETQ